MKVLETQNALLSNYEVYQHLVDQQSRDKATNRKAPAKFAAITSEVIKYLREKPGPLATQEEKHAYSPNSVQQLLEKIREANLPSDLAKGEFLQILNVRPSSSAQLSAIVEDMEERFNEEQQTQLIDIITEVLGRDDSTEIDVEDVNAMESIENGN